MAGKLDDFFNVQMNEITRQLNKKVYCQICGKEIILYGGEADRYRYEVREEAHIDCIRQYQEEMKKRYLEEQEKKQQENNKS